jgi:hypothetical protein
MAGIEIIDERQPPTMGDAWSEYLCIEKVGENEFELSLRIYEFLGQYADFCDDDGEFLNPRKIDGKEVMAIEDEYIIGGDLIKKSEDEQITFRQNSTDEVRGWLKRMDWDEHRIDGIIDRLPN